MGRLILAALLAPVFYAILQLPGNLTLFSLYPAAAEPAFDAPMSYLLLGLCFSFVYGTFAGFCSAWVAGGDPRRAGVASGTVLLLVGIAVQSAYWDQLPLWWHLVFLAAIVPMAMLGAQLRSTLGKTADPEPG